jgi:hypothetical protein
LRSAEEKLFCHFPNFYEADDKSPLYFYLKGKKSYKNQPALVYTCRIDSLGRGHIVGSDPFVGRAQHRIESPGVGGGLPTLRRGLRTGISRQLLSHDLSYFRVLLMKI